MDNRETCSGHCITNHNPLLSPSFALWINGLAMCRCNRTDPSISTAGCSRPWLHKDNFAIRWKESQRQKTSLNRCSKFCRHKQFRFLWELCDRKIRRRLWQPIAFHLLVYNFWSNIRAIQVYVLHSLQASLLSKPFWQVRATDSYSTGFVEFNLYVTLEARYTSLSPKQDSAFTVPTNSSEKSQDKKRGKVGTHRLASLFRRIKKGVESCLCTCPTFYGIKCCCVERALHADNYNGVWLLSKAHNCLCVFVQPELSKRSLRLEIWHW